MAEVIPYKAFRTGLTYNDVFRMLWSHSEDASTWRHKSRGSVLGKWRQIKLEMYAAYLELATAPRPACDATCFCEACVSMPAPAPDPNLPLAIRLTLERMPHARPLPALQRNAAFRRRDRPTTQGRRALKQRHLSALRNHARRLDAPTARPQTRPERATGHRPDYPRAQGPPSDLRPL